MSGGLGVGRGGGHHKEESGQREEPEKLIRVFCRNLRRHFNTRKKASFFNTHCQKGSEWSVSALRMKSKYM